MTLPEICHLSIDRAAQFFSDLELDATRAVIATEALKEIRGRLGFLTNVGLNYLSLDRTAPTLSGGETQRIRLAGQIGLWPRGRAVHSRRTVHRIAPAGQ